MRNEQRGFVKGFVAATILLGALGAYAVGELYTPNPESSDWIRNPAKYAPGTADQINVLADLQPGAPDVMFTVGHRLNTLAMAGKKANWEIAGFEADEIEEAFDRLMLTRPELATDLETFLTTKMAPVHTAIGASDKAGFDSAFPNLVAACNTCHQSYDFGFMVVKPGKVSEPLKF